VNDPQEPTPAQEWAARCQEAISAMAVELVKRSPLDDQEETLCAVASGLLGATVTHVMACEGFEEEHFEQAARELIAAFDAQVDELYAKYEGGGLPPAKTELGKPELLHLLLGGVLQIDGRQLALGNFGLVSVEALVMQARHALVNNLGRTDQVLELTE
jgi:hypothetical protein